MAYLLATVGVLILADQVYERIIVPLGVRVGNGISYVTDTPERIKNIHENNLHNKDKIRRSAVVAEIKNRHEKRKEQMNK